VAQTLLSELARLGTTEKVNRLLHWSYRRRLIQKKAQLVNNNKSPIVIAGITTHPTVVRL
jgi:hypothetical protein